MTLYVDIGQASISRHLSLESFLEPQQGNEHGPRSNGLMCFYCHGEANRVVMTPHLPQADVGGKKKKKATVKSPTRPRAVYGQECS